MKKKKRENKCDRYSWHERDHPDRGIQDVPAHFLKQEDHLFTRLPT